MAKKGTKFVVTVTLYRDLRGASMTEEQFGLRTRQRLEELMAILPRCGADLDDDEFSIAIDKEDKDGVTINLCNKAAKHSLDPGELDELVHACADEVATAINNDGVEAQIRYMVEEMGVAAAAKLLEEIFADHPVSDRLLEPEYNMSKLGTVHPDNTGCPACYDRGWIVTSLYNSQFCPNGTIGVARCDHCNILYCDDEAIPLAEAAGLRVSHLYPFWLLDSPTNGDLFAQCGVPDGTLKWPATVKGIPHGTTNSSGTP